MSRPTGEADAGSRFRNPVAPTVSVGGGPTDVAVDQANHTAYVTNANDSTVSMVDMAICDATNTSGCNQVAPAAAVGSFPVAAVVDVQSQTVYVTNAGANTVSMIDTATCNATISSGCSVVPTATVGPVPDFADVDTVTHTVYVVNAGDNTVSVLDAATCNATTTSGCGRLSTVAVGNVPTGLAVDEANRTVYVATGLGLITPGSVSMINAATCNATVTSGCSRTPRTTPASIGAAWVAVDPATHTVYVATGPTTAALTSLGSVDVIDADTCDATMTSGCRTKPIAVTVGSVSSGVVVDPETHSVFVVNEEDSTVSVIYGPTCRADFTGGCNQHPPTVAVGFNPATLAVDVSTHTVYVPNFNENTVSVLDGAACTLAHQSGCRKAAPTTTIGFAPSGVAVNLVTDTVYVSNRSDNDLSVINAATCNAADRSGCGEAWPTVATGVGPQTVAVDQGTDTIYTANDGPNADGNGTTVSVIDGITCNSHVTSGCGRAPATVFVGSAPNALAVNEATDTIYVANANTDAVSVIDGTTCNATDHSGCGLTQPTITVDGGSDGVAVDQRTDTVYVANGALNTVSVIDGATCNAATTSGCGQKPPVVHVGSAPVGVAVDAATDTIYVANIVDNTLSVIDGTTCNGTNHSGCGQKPPVVRVGNGPAGVAVDAGTDTVFVGALFDAEVDIVNGSRCNATVTTGCSRRVTTVPVGGFPAFVADDRATHTVYAPDNTDGEVSFFGDAGGVPYP